MFCRLKNRPLSINRVLSAKFDISSKQKIEHRGQSKFGCHSSEKHSRRDASPTTLNHKKQVGNRQFAVGNCRIRPLSIFRIFTQLYVHFF